MHWRVKQNAVKLCKTRKITVGFKWRLHEIFFSLYDVNAEGSTTCYFSWATACWLNLAASWWYNHMFMAFLWETLNVFISCFLYSQIEILKLALSQIFEASFYLLRKKVVGILVLKHSWVTVWKINTILYSDINLKFQMFPLRFWNLKNFPASSLTLYTARVKKQ